MHDNNKCIKKIDVTDVGEVYDLLYLFQEDEPLHNMGILNNDGRRISEYIERFSESICPGFEPQKAHYEGSDLAECKLLGWAFFHVIDTKIGSKIMT